MTRTVFIGDTHGCRDELSSLLDALCFSPGSDRIILLGDLMDKGPDPVGVVRMARDLGFESVKGNHDEKHCRYRKHEERRAIDSKKNPMRFSDIQKVQNISLDLEDVKWLSSLPDTLQVGEWVAVHAGFEPGFPFEKQKPDHLCRVRWVDVDGKMISLNDSLDQPGGSKWWFEAHTFDFNVVYGHAAHSLKKPQVSTAPNGRRCIGLDTGCVYGGHLSAYILEEDRFVQVKAKEAHAVWHGTDHDN